MEALSINELSRYRKVRYDFTKLHATDLPLKKLRLRQGGARGGSGDLAHK